MFPYEVVDYVDVLLSRIDYRVLRNVVVRGIMCHDRYGDSVTQLC